MISVIRVGLALPFILTGAACMIVAYWIGGVPVREAIVTGLSERLDGHRTWQKS